MTNRAGVCGRLLATAAVALSFLAAPLPLSAAGGGGGGGSQPSASSTASEPDYAAGKKAIDAGDWSKAVAYFSKVVTRDTRNADAFNWLGYAYRKSGDYEAAFRNYERALAINPDHRGAHEYIGEAYLKIGNLAKAEEHLKALDRICFFGCKEYTELKEKIGEFRANKSS